MPWDELTISWGPVVSIIISILKRFGLSKNAIPYVTWVLGFFGMFLYRITSGMEVINALLNAFVVLLSAPGFYELISKPLGKTVAKNS